MKKFLLPSFIFFISLSFCFISKVFADDINLTYSDFSHVTTDDFNNFKSWLDNYLVEHSDYNFYEISWLSDSGGYYWATIGDVSSTGYYVFNQANRSRFQFYTLYNKRCTASYSNGSVTLNVCSSSYYESYLTPPYTIFSTRFLYSTHPLLVASGNTTPVSISVDGVNYGTYNAGDIIPQMYDIYLDKYSTPPDETPLLTSFFSLTIEKLQFITEYFSSNYIYLSIFAIFILIFFIYLIKRRLY